MEGYQSILVLFLKSDLSSHCKLRDNILTVHINDVYYHLFHIGIFLYIIFIPPSKFGALSVSSWFCSFRILLHLCFVLQLFLLLRLALIIVYIY